MTITNGYTTFEDVDLWLNGQLQSSDRGNVELAISATSRWIDQYCGRHFFQETATRTFRPDHYCMVSLGCDLVSVSAFVNSGTTWTTTNYELLYAPGQYTNHGEARPYRYVESVLRNYNLWQSSGRPDTVSITGVWGWPAVPDSVTQAAKIQTAAIHRRKQSPGGIEGSSDFGIVRTPRDIDPTVATLLAPYRVDFGIG